MKLFISWSGERSKALAHALKDWFPLVLHYVEPWLSEADIGAGDRWADAVAKELETSKLGIICITRENLNSPWVLFEAGALAKSLEGSRVIPLLLDLDFSEVVGPLAQFQAKKVEKKGLLETVHSLNEVAAQPLPEARWKQLFELAWPGLEKQANEIPVPGTPHKPSRSQAAVLEELVGAVRSMESKMRDSAEEPRPIPRKRIRFHPGMMRELGHLLSERPGDPVNLLVIASSFRDEVPWLYELGVEAYRQAASRSRHAKPALRKFLRAVELMRGGLFEELGIDVKLTRSVLHELEYMMDHQLLDEASIAREEAEPSSP